MREKRNRVQAVLCLSLLACGMASAVPYSWSGGDGRWDDPLKWNPNGVPGALDDASFLVNAPQTVTIGADATPFSMSLDTGLSGAAQTFSVDPGVNLTLDRLTLASTHPTVVTFNGGGRIAATNEALWVSGTANNPISFAVAGPGTVFDMPKPAGSGLYIGAKEEAYKDCDDSFHVTACATVLVANATCIGNSLPRSESDQTVFSTRGKLVVDDGSYFYGGKVLFLGRGYQGSLGNGCVLAVTNATVEATQIDGGHGNGHLFVGSNATVRASSKFSFPAENSRCRDARLHFEDSNITSEYFKVLFTDCSGVTGLVTRSHVACNRLGGASKGARDSEFTMEDSILRSPMVEFGGLNSSNCVLRLVRSDVAVAKLLIGYSNVLESAVCVEGGDMAIGVMHVGEERTAQNARYEQIGGTFTSANGVCTGIYDSKRCGAVFRGVSLSSKLICGDKLQDGLRSDGAYMTLADMVKVESPLIYVGVSSINAHLYVTNSTVSLTYESWGSSTEMDAHSLIVGKESGATGNVFLLEDSTVNQTGGNVFVGRYAGATNNTLRLVRSAYNFSTTNSKGDVIVGYAESASRFNAHGNRLELDDHSTFTYDRNWFAVGQYGPSNVLAICNGSHLNLSSSSSQLQIGSNSSAIGNRLVMENGGSVRANRLYLKNQAVVEISGVGNTMTFDADISISDNCSYVFRPGAAASDTPMLTINRAFQYSATKKMHLDVAEAGIGRHVLVTSTSALDEPVAGSSVILHNVPRIYSARVFRSADTKSLVCSVAPTGTMLLFR